MSTGTQDSSASTVATTSTDTPESTATVSSDGTSGVSSGDIDPELCAGFMNVWPGDVELTEPADKAQLFGIECIAGNLWIHDGVEDLLGLESLVRVEWNVTVHGLQHPGSLASLKGLDNLEHALHFTVYHSSLTTLEGLESLKELAGGLEIYGSKVESLSGLTSLTHVDGWFRLGSQGADYGQPALTDLVGLESLVSVGMAFEIYATSLSDLKELAALQSIGGYVSVVGNSDLPTCVVLDFLTSVTIGEGSFQEGNKADQCGGP